MIPVRDTRGSERFGPGWTYITPSAWDWHEPRPRREDAWISLRQAELLAQRSSVIAPYWDLTLGGDADMREVPYVAWPDLVQLPTSNRKTAWRLTDDGHYVCAACNGFVNPAWAFCPYCGGEAGHPEVEDVKNF